MKSQDIVNECMLMFNCPSAEETNHKRNVKFLNKYATADNLLFCLSDIAPCVIATAMYCCFRYMLNFV